MKPMEFTREEKEISKAILKSSKTVKQLTVELDMGPKRVEKALKNLTALGVVRELKGRYSLVADVRRGVMGKEVEETDLPLKVHALIEGQSKDKEILARANEALINNLKKDKLIKACNFIEEDIIKEKRVYYVLFECDVYAKSFEDLLYFVINYGPSSIEFEEPAKFEINRNEAQGVLMDVASVIHSYMNTIQKLKQDQEIILK